MRRTFLLLVALVILISGAFGLQWMGRLHLMMGWASGVAIALANFATLLSNVQCSAGPAETAKGEISRSLRKRFFIRYLALAAAFFLVLQLGREQLGSAVLGFFTFYVTILVQYILQLARKKPSGSS